MKTILICVFYYALVMGLCHADWGQTCLIATCPNVPGYIKQGDALVSLLKKDGISPELCYAVKSQGVTAIGAPPDKAEFWELFVSRTDSKHAETLVRSHIRYDGPVKLCHIDM